MNKQYFLKALQCTNRPNEIPFWELEFHLWNSFSQKKCYLGEAFEKLTTKEKEKALHVNVDVMAEVCEKLNFSALTIPGPYWEIAPGKPAYYWLPEKERFEFTELLVKAIGNEVALIANTTGVLSIPESQRYVEFATQMFENPEAIISEAESLLKRSKESIKQFKELGIDIFLTASDIADSSGPFFYSEHFHEYILPFLIQWSDFIKENEGLSIMHSDGNIMMYANVIAGTSLNGLQAIDPIAGMDIIALKEEVKNNICLCGNIDCGLILTGEPEQIYRNTTDLLQKISISEGFSLGSSNAIEINAPKENFEAMVHAYQDFLRNKA